MLPKHLCRNSHTSPVQASRPIKSSFSAISVDGSAAVDKAITKHIFEEPITGFSASQTVYPQFEVLVTKASNTEAPL